MVMRILLVMIAVYCLTACGTKETKDAALRVTNNSDDAVTIQVTGGSEVQEISRTFTISPRQFSEQQWDYKVKRKPGKTNAYGDYDVEIKATRSNGAVLMWRRFTDLDALNATIICSDRNCSIQ